MLTQGAQTASPLTADELPSWTFSPDRTEAGFSARRMGVTWVDGRFKDVHGKLYLDPERPLASTCFGEIDVTKLYAGEPRLNTQLRVADFLGVKDPKITFAGQLVDRTGDTHFKTDAYLTLRGTTRLVTMYVTYLGQWKAPFWMDGEEKGTVTRVGLKATGVITRRDFEIVSADELPGERIVATSAIEITLDIEATLDADLATIGALELCAGRGGVPADPSAVH
jgi:polyisoprenoid-binding protein YceI